MQKWSTAATRGGPRYRNVNYSCRDDSRCSANAAEALSLVCRWRSNEQNNYSSFDCSHCPELAICPPTTAQTTGTPAVQQNIFTVFVPRFPGRRSRWISAWLITVVAGSGAFVASWHLETIWCLCLNLQSWSHEWSHWNKLQWHTAFVWWIIFNWLDNQSKTLHTRTPGFCTNTNDESWISGFCIIGTLGLIPRAARTL